MNLNIGLDELRESVEKMKMQVAESNRQENQLMKRLVLKEREVQELLVSVHLPMYCKCA
jgi:hypothetical protein